MKNPITKLIHSRRFMIFIGTVFTILTIHFVPDLKPYFLELTVSFTLLAGLFIDRLTVENIAAAPIKSQAEIDQAIADSLNDFIAAITPDAIEALVPKLTPEEVQRIIDLLTKNATPST